MKSSVGSYKIRGVIELLRMYRPVPMVVNLSSNNSNVVVAAANPRVGDNGFGNMQLTGLRFLHAASSSSSSSMGNDGPSSPPKLPSPRPPSPPGGGRFPMWENVLRSIIQHNSRIIDYFGRAKLVVGSVFSLLLAFWTPNLPTLLKIGGEAEVVVKEVEQVAEVVEKVAVVMEKVSEEVTEILPDGNKFKETALIVEHVSKEAAKDAHIADEILHKLDVVKHDLEGVEEIVEPLIDTIKHDDSSNKAAKS